MHNILWLCCVAFAVFQVLPQYAILVKAKNEETGWFYAIDGHDNA